HGCCSRTEHRHTTFIVTNYYERSIVSGRAIADDRRMRSSVMDASAASRLPARGAWAPELPEAAGFEHTMVNLPGPRMHVASVGSGDPVVMLPGVPRRWWEWRSVAPRIAAAGYRVICPDLRGSGWTEAAEPGFTRHVMREDLVALLDELSISEAH